MFNDRSEVKMMISESLYGGNNALSLSLSGIFSTRVSLTVSTVFEESTTHSRHSPVLTPTPAEPFSPLSLREKGARSVIDEEKDRKLHLALQRSNFTSTSSDSQVSIYYMLL